MPYNIDNGYELPTDWQLEGTATLAGALPKTGTTYFGNGTVNAFTDPQAALNAFAYTAPGASGIRNVLRGDGYFGLDANLAKSWAMPWRENQTLQFRWEVFNVPNAVRFNVDSSLTEIDIGSTFGNYTGLSRIGAVSSSTGWQERLCRLTCGKAAPFRGAAMLNRMGRGYASARPPQWLRPTRSPPEAPVAEGPQGTACRVLPHYLSAV